MKILRKNGPWLVVATVIGGHVFAQPAPTEAPKSPQKAAATPAISAEAAKRQAQDMRNQVRVHIQHVQHLQAKARKEKDVIKLTCVNDKFIKLKAEANIFDASHRELIARVDSDSERPELFGGVTKAANDVRRVREEADGCIGEPQLGEASVNDYTSPELLDDPTLGLPFDITVEPPAYASPYT